jgi:3-oxoacyl-[acyl-carrier protein] reductase
MAADDPPAAAPGRVVLISGGNRGIGLACAQAFAAAGDRVAVTYRTDAPEGYFGVRCDVTDTAQVDAAFDEVERSLGPVDVLVANAAIGTRQLVMRATDEEALHVLDTNVMGVLRLARRAATSMAKRRAGRIVFVSSIVGAYGAPGAGVYAASKAALTGLARSLTRELGGRGVTCNVVAPGMVETDLLGIASDQLRTWATDICPAGRAGTPAEVAAAVRFLASDEASYVNGVVLPVDGGLAMGL